MGGKVIEIIERSSLREPILNKRMFPVSDNQEPEFLPDWLNKHSDVYKDGTFFTESGEEAKLIIIFAGTCAGKTTFVTQILPGENRNVYFICSRKLVKLQQKKKRINPADSSKKDDKLYFSDDNHLVIGTSWDLIKSRNYREARKADYIVVDEAHHLTADTFCEAPNYLDELLNNVRPEQKVILMTACAEYFEKAIKSEFGGGEFFDLPISPVCVFDLRKCCTNLYPKDIKIIDPGHANELVNSQDTEKYQSIYFCTSAKDAYTAACKAILDGKNAVAITSSKSYLPSIISHHIKSVEKKGTEKKPRENSARILKDKNYNLAIKKLNNLPKLINRAHLLLKNERYPKSIDIIFTTSKMREGLNINKYSRRLIIFSELIDPVSIIQVAGRIRKDNEQYKFDCLYLVVQPKRYMSIEEQARTLKKTRDIDLHIEKMGSYNEFFSEMLGDVDSQLLSIGSQRIAKMAAKNKMSVQEFYSHKFTIQRRKNVNEVYNIINKVSKFPGLWLAKPIRDKNDNIFRYDLVPSQLWFIHQRIINYENYWSYPANLNDADKLCEKVKTIFPEACVKILKNENNLSDEKSDCFVNDLGEVKKIVSKYANRTNNYINRKEYDDLHAELEAVHFIEEQNYIGSAIKEIGFHGEWKNKKRLQYKIIEI